MSHNKHTAHRYKLSLKSWVCVGLEGGWIKDLKKYLFTFVDDMAGFGLNLLKIHPQRSVGTQGQPQGSQFCEFWD